MKMVPMYLKSVTLFTAAHRTDVPVGLSPYAETSPIKTVKDLEGKRIATEVVNLTKQFLKEKGR